MRKTLTLVEETATANHALKIAVAKAERESAALIVLTVVPETDFDARQRSVDGTGLRGFTYTVTQAEESATAVAERAAAAAVGDREIPYLAVGAVGRPREVVLETAAAHGCTEIVVPDLAPRWFGLFGRFDRALAWRFDGTVTRVAGPAGGDGRPLSVRESTVDTG